MTWRYSGTTRPMLNSWDRGRCEPPIVGAASCSARPSRVITYTPVSALVAEAPWWGDECPRSLAHTWCSIKWAVAWMKTSSTSGALLACTDLPEAVHEKKGPIKLPRLLQVVQIWRLQAGRGGGRGRGVIKPRSFVLQTLASAFEARCGTRGEQQEPNHKGRKEILTECLPSNLIYVRFNTYHTGELVLFPCYSKRHHVSEKLPYITTIVKLSSGRPRSQVQSVCPEYPWTFHSKYGMSPRWEMVLNFEELMV